ncbi:MAG: endolytic transglycosylase MltG, partial [Acidobacteria bacterium]|nr:endolytic transglycosylase MltG [Acidobacteriota bacterium]
RAAADARQLTVRQAVTLASLIEEETARPDEAPLVSAVYQNRLAIRMPLQCDPTVIYGLRRRGTYGGRLTRSDLASPTPYNTYLRGGLPPGPIANPGEKSLRAALCPGNHEYLYFVSMNTGSHHFSRTLAEHEQAVRRYQE